MRRPDRTTIVWLALVIATCLSWWLHVGGPTSRSAASAGIIVVAFIKVRLIGRDFMELRRAPRGLRVLLDLYTTVVPVALTVMYLAQA